MAKTAAIAVRIPPHLKEAIQQQAAADGRSMASYVERVLALHGQPPVWILRDAQPIKRRKGEPAVSLPVAEGWPAAVLDAARAEALGKQLIAAAAIARKLPPAE
jgi:hypothetical protein